MATNGSKPHTISTIAELEALYTEGVYPPAKVKETDRITKAYRALVEASPFFALATNGPNGLDCSPRGDPQGLRPRRRRQDHRRAGPARQQSHRQSAQPHQRSARRAVVPHPRCQRDAAHHGPRYDLDRSGAVREFHHAGQGAALGAGDRGGSGVLPMRQGDRALQAVGSGDPGRARRACRRRERSWPKSAAARWAARSTTASRQSA